MEELVTTEHKYQQLASGTSSTSSTARRRLQLGGELDQLNPLTTQAPVTTSNGGIQESTISGLWIFTFDSYNITYATSS